MPFDPWPDTEVHLEWGPQGSAGAAARGDAVVIVDVLSFSTTLTVAAERGMTSIVMTLAEVEAAGGLDAAAEQVEADPISRHRDVAPGGLSLSPSAMLAATHAERILVTSLNGAECVAAGDGSPLLVIGGLRNARACADLLAGRLRHAGAPGRVTVVPAGELWESTQPGTAGSRPSLEDWAGAGLLIRHLVGNGLSPSAEAQVAAQSRVPSDDLYTCISARELMAKGFGDDLAPAFAADVSAAVPTRTWGPGRVRVISI